MNRRSFLKDASFTLAAAQAASVLPALRAEAQAPAEKKMPPFRIGVVGPGSRGKELIRQFSRVPSVEVAAICDVYTPRFGEVFTVLSREMPTYTDYRALLDRKDLDAIVVATPPKLHAEVVIAALRSGRPVYGEKMMGFTVDDCKSIVKAVAETKQHYQVGYQYRYAPWYVESLERIRRGEIGDVTHVYGYWHRNNDWRRVVPDAKYERLMNWRLYTDTSKGLLEELGTHMIDTANIIFGGMPESVMMSGSIANYHDGRTTDDNVQAIYTYAGGKRFVFSSLTDNAQQGCQTWVYGTKGSVQLTIEDATFFYEKATFKALQASSPVVQKGLATGASYRASSEMPYRGEGHRVAVANPEEPTLTAVRSFVQCVRDNKRPFADEHVGYGGAVAVSVGIDAKEQERTVRFGDLRMS